MKIKIGDFKTTKTQRKVINDILRSNNITEGKYVNKFERLVEKFIGVKHAIAVTNGTVSLQLLAYYLKQRIGKDKPIVCVPALTFPATLNPFLMTGYKPILCDIDKNNLCMDIDNLTKKEKENIDVIVPVSLLGYLPNMDKIMKQAKKYGWVVIEDFAEAFGSTYKNKRLGSIGDFGSSSFFISHIFQGGELGVITTNDNKANKILRSMKTHGRINDHLKFNHKYIGSNYKTTEFCSGLAYIQLKNASAILNKRRENTRILTKGITNPNISLMKYNDDNILLGFPMFSNKKKRLCNLLNKNGIETREMFPCLTNQTAYKDIDFKGGYKNALEIEKKGLYIGVHQLITKNQLNKIIRICNAL